jgi:hypothetical protein
MKPKPILIIAAFLFLIISCGNGPEATMAVKGPGYSLEIPESMTKTTSLNDEASLQYQDLMKQLFVITINEPKSQLQAAIDDNDLYDQYTYNLKGYYDLIITNFQSSFSLENLPSPTDTTIHGLPAKVVELEGDVDGDRVYCKLAFIEGKKHYYQVMAWTNAGRKQALSKTIADMVASFKETTKSKY